MIYIFGEASFMMHRLISLRKPILFSMLFKKFDRLFYIAILLCKFFFDFTNKKLLNKGQKISKANYLVLIFYKRNPNKMIMYGRNSIKKEFCSLFGRNEIICFWDLPTLFKSHLISKGLYDVIVSTKNLWFF